MLGTMADVHAFHDGLHLLLALRLRDVEVSERKFDILLHIQLIYQIEALEHKSDFSLSYIRALLLLQVFHLMVAQEIFSRGWIVEQTENVKQG